MACSTARALASTMSVEAPCPESDLPATRTCTNTWPRLSPPGVTDWIARFTTSTRRSTTALIAAIAAAIGPLPLAVALRSPDQGPVSRTVAEAVRGRAGGGDARRGGDRVPPAARFVGGGEGADWVRRRGGGGKALFRVAAAWDPPRGRGAAPRHDDLLQRGVARALADPVDG